MKQEHRILLEHMGAPNMLMVEGYRATGGYDTLESALKEQGPDEVLDVVKNSGLYGRGGAGFPTGMKWSFLPHQTQKPVYLCVNADESEPGTCKDRVIIDENPHVLLEGILLTCYAIGSHKAFIYIRGEFHRGAEILLSAIEDAKRFNIIGENILGSDFSCDVDVYRGAGAYVCGEETGLLTSLEGERGFPRNKPPFPAVSGLYDCPTIINNVETLAAVPSIIKNGAEWFKSMGSDKSPGTKLLCLSGHVNAPGVYEVELGKMTLREFINDHGGGVREGRTIKGVIPGGSSMPVMREEELDVNLTFEDIKNAGSSLGSGAIIVMDDTVDMVEMALMIAKFYEHESCGQCTPCREGTRWFVQILEAIIAGEGRPEDMDLLLDICRSEMTSICPLWVAAVWPVRAFITQYKDEFEEKIRQGKYGQPEANPSVAMAG